MNKNTESLRTYFRRLDLDPKIADIYQALRADGPQTISELSRTSGVERIRIYRLLDSLKASGLIEVEMRYKRSILHAAPISSLQILIAKREQEVKDLQRDYVALTRELTTKSMQSQGARVQFYEGMDGVKQMLWNQTRGAGDSYAVLHDNMQHKTNLAFFERWVKKCNQKNRKFYGIVGDAFIRTQQEWYASYTNERLRHWEARYVPESVFAIPYTIVVYDDIVLHYDWNDERMFGIEIHNVAMARVQRQFFDILWRQAEPVNDLQGPRGVIE